MCNLPSLGGWRHAVKRKTKSAAIDVTWGENYKYIPT
jgi:hypothetical protein